MATNISMAVANGTHSQGWTDSPDGRGTWDIILTCTATIFLCCWTSVYPNIAASTDRYRSRFQDKLGLALLGLLGPEFLLVLATGQRSSARRSVKKFHAEGYTDWTLTHAHYADMGGFTLEPSDEDRMPPFPVDANQLFYLVKHEYVEYPAISKEEIDDKDKSDGLSRFIAIIQAVAFLVTLIARAVQGIAITTFEITTVSFVIILFATAYCWKDKPSDVETTFTIHLKDSITIRLILSRGGPKAALPWYHTPFDFVSRCEEPLNLLFQYYNDILRKLWFSPFSRPVRSRPWNRIPGDIFHKMDFDHELVSEVFVLVFSTVFLFAWNFHFPSEFEKMAWRVSALYMLMYGFLGSIQIALWGWLFLPQRRSASGLAGEEMSLNPIQRWLNRKVPARPSISPQRRDAEETVVEQLIPNSTSKSTGRSLLVRIKNLVPRTHNMSPDHDPYMDVPTAFLIPTTFLCAVYCIFRGYILLEDFFGLRSLSPTSFETVNWSRFIPHL